MQRPATARFRVLSWPESDPKARAKAAEFVRFVQAGRADSFLPYPSAFVGRPEDGELDEGKGAIDLIFLGEDGPGENSFERAERRFQKKDGLVVLRDGIRIKCICHKRGRMYWIDSMPMADIVAEIARLYWYEKPPGKKGSQKVGSQAAPGGKRTSHEPGTVSSGALLAEIPESHADFRTFRGRVRHGKLLPLRRLLEHPYARHLQGNVRRKAGKYASLHISVVAETGAPGEFTDLNYLAWPAGGPGSLADQLDEVDRDIREKFDKAGLLRAVKVFFAEEDASEIQEHDERKMKDFDFARPDYASHHPSLLWYYSCRTEEDLRAMEVQMEATRLTGRGTVLDGFMRLLAAREPLTSPADFGVFVGFLPFKLFIRSGPQKVHTLELDSDGSVILKAPKQLSARLTWPGLQRLLREATAVGVGGFYGPDFEKLAIQWSPFWDLERLPNYPVAEWAEASWTAKIENEILAELNSTDENSRMEDMLKNFEPRSFDLTSWMPIGLEETEWLDRLALAELLGPEEDRRGQPEWPGDLTASPCTVTYRDGTSRLALLTRLVQSRREPSVITVTLSAGADVVYRQIPGEEIWSSPLGHELEIHRLALTALDRDLGLTEEDCVDLITRMGYLLRVRRITTTERPMRTWIDPSDGQIRQFAQSLEAWLDTGSESSYYAGRHGFGYQDSASRYRAVWNIASETDRRVAPLHLAADLPPHALLPEQQAWLQEAHRFMRDRTREVKDTGEQYNVLEEFRYLLRSIGDIGMPRGALGTILGVLTGLDEEQLGVLGAEQIQARMDQLMDPTGELRREAGKEEEEEDGDYEEEEEEEEYELSSTDSGMSDSDSDLSYNAKRAKHV